MSKREEVKKSIKDLIRQLHAGKELGEVKERKGCWESESIDLKT